MNHTFEANFVSFPPSRSSGCHEAAVEPTGLVVFRNFVGI